MKTVLGTFKCPLCLYEEGKINPPMFIQKKRDTPLNPPPNFRSKKTSPSRSQEDLVSQQYSWKPKKKTDQEILARSEERRRIREEKERAKQEKRKKEDRERQRKHAKEARKIRAELDKHREEEERKIRAILAKKHEEEERARKIREARYKMRRVEIPKKHRGQSKISNQPNKPEQKGDPVNPQYPQEKITELISIASQKNNQRSKRLSAIQVLGEKGDPRALGLLNSFLNHPDMDFRRYAREAIELIHSHRERQNFAQPR